MRLKYLVCLLLLYGVCIGQPTRPGDYGLNEYVLHDKLLGEIRFYVSQKGINEKKPVLLFLDGSGHYPLTTYVQLKKSAFIFNTFDKDILAQADKFHVVFVSKPGTRFCDTLVIDRDSVLPTEAAELLPPSKEYLERSGLRWRADAASKVIDFVCNHLPVDKSKIIAYGYSEGAQVVSRVAVLNKKVTHCASIAGSGLNQFYDFVTAVRIKAERGIISQQEAQQRVNALFAVFDSIYMAPNDIGRQWEGHTYKRWAEYCSDVPLDNFLKLNIPIFIAACSNDENSPIYGLEYVRLEFLRRQKKNLTFKVYPADHYFNEKVQVDGKDTLISHKQEMIQQLMQWIKSPHVAN